jgi:hypothetical protein
VKSREKAITYAPIAVKMFISMTPLTLYHHVHDVPTLNLEKVKIKTQKLQLQSLTQVSKGVLMLICLGPG